MQGRENRQLVIDVTYTFDATGTRATVNRVGNALGEEITADFILFARQHGLALSTQQEIERAASEFVEARKNILP